MTRANPHSTAREDGSCDDDRSVHGVPMRELATGETICIGDEYWNNDLRQWEPTCCAGMSVGIDGLNAGHKRYRRRVEPSVRA